MISLIPNAPRLCCTVLIVIGFLMLASAVVRPQDAAPGKVMLEGQLVCSECDKQYVTADDLKVLPPAEESAQQPAALGSDPELTLQDLFGVEQRLSAYRGNIVVLNFWATWCIPCRKEMQDLAAFQNDYAALGVQVIGAGADTLAARSRVLQFVKEMRINFPVWLGATTDDMKRFGLGPALPGTAIIGRDGKIVLLRPAVITHSELKKEIDNLLASDTRSIKSEIAATRSAPVDASLVPS